MNMHFNPEISLGNLLTIVTLIGIALRAGWLLGGVQAIILEHTKRLDKYETMLIDVVGKMQRLIGRMNGVDNRD